MPELALNAMYTGSEEAPWCESAQSGGGVDRQRGASVQRPGVLPDTPIAKLCRNHHHPATTHQSLGLGIQQWVEQSHVTGPHVGISTSS